MNAARVIGYALAYLWAFWAVYALVMGFYRAHLAGRLTPALWVLAAPFILLGLLMDALCQFTLAWLIFWQPPSLTVEHRVFAIGSFARVLPVVRGDWLVTARLQRYVAEGSGWRFRLANWVCNNLLDIFDPTGNHC